MKTYEVQLTVDGARDLQEIYEYIARHDSIAQAGHVLDRMVDALQGLSTAPERGAFCKELLPLGIRQFRESFFKPYRVVYRIEGDTVYVMLIADGRRDMETLLRQRLIEG